VKELSVTVFGDEFRDRYWLGSTSRISPEAPIPVVRIEDTKEFWGGAGNVILNLTSLGVRVSAAGPRYNELPIKNRLCVGDYQLARWDEQDTVPELRIGAVAESTLYKPEGIVISDYGKGSITYEVIEAIAGLNLPTYIDSKRNPRDFDIILHPTFFPNQKEYDEHIHDYRLQPNVILKRGAAGIERQSFGRVVESYPTWADRVVSVCGAGDTVLSAYVYAELTGQFRPLVFANAAAAVVVGKPYTAVATLDEIRSVLSKVEIPTNVL
jgi:D-beta-D-heptose 7-phosphate kinase / D-beta-D-heptose 1-phosphate adenosyltransferase